jgi:hypothetical protein
MLKVASGTDKVAFELSKGVENVSLTAAQRAQLLLLLLLLLAAARSVCCCARGVCWLQSRVLA